MPPQSEKAFMGQVVQAAQLLGWRTYHTFDSRRSPAGFPDLVLVRRDRLLFVECKRVGARLSVAQAEWLGALAAVPWAEIAVWRPDDWPRIDDTLR